MTAVYVEQLVSAYPGITDVWLFGSHANGTANADSDWDYLIWTDDAGLLNKLHQDRRFDLTTVDPLVVVDGGTAIRPWPDLDGSWKKLRLHEDLEWDEVSPTQATYLAAKKRNPDNPRDIAVDLKRAKAQLVYRRA